MEKTIRKLNLADGTTLTNQYKILDEVKSFYGTLFQQDDLDLKENSIPSILKDIKFNKINDPDLGQPISENELAIALKKMKNGKTPGNDGIISEFLKVF